MTNKFDNIAPEYDSHFTYSKIGKKQRSLVYKHLESILPQDKSWNILEINAGTGEDSLWLANKGHNVLCTDISEGMMEQARSKKTNVNLTFKTLDINNINENTFEKKFDLIFSNFGGINCLSPDELDSFLKKSNALLSNSGRLVLVIMPKNCLWENLFFSLKREWLKVGRRKQEFAIANVGEEKVKTYYFNPSDLEFMTEALYKDKTAKPIGLFIPPSYLEPLFKERNWLLNIFYILDLILQPFAFLSKYADHYLIDLKRK